MTCTKCESSGFTNLAAVPDAIIIEAERTGDPQTILDYIKATPDSDVAVCDCCGNGDYWYGNPGEHEAGGRCA